MEIASVCPFPTAKIIWQSQQRTHALTIIVKVTFLLIPGTAAVAPTQEPILNRDKPWEDGPRQSVRASNDQVPYKPRADVLLVGHAYAPAKQPARSVTTRLMVGEVDKRMDVFCDRVIRVVDGQLLEGQGFTRMPLRWERAAGGPNTNNPVGVRFDAPPDGYGVVMIPNLQPPGTIVSKRSDVFAPVCYAPIPPGWPSRMQRLRRLSRLLVEGGWENEPLPEDLDPLFFQAAPPDQTTREINPNEKIVLENLHPERERLVTTLPGIRPRAVADRATGEREEITLVGDTLWIDADRGIASVVWRGRMGLRHAAEAGRITVWADGFSAVEPAARTAKPRINETFRVSPEKAKNEPPLPFSPGNSRLAVRTARVEKPVPRRMGKEIKETVRLTGKETVEPALPFGPKEVLVVAPVVAAPPAESSNAPFFVAPPPMIGPLATPEMSERPKEAPIKEVMPAPVKAPEPIAVELPKKSDPQAFPLEQCAALTASMARRKAEKNAILQENELTAREWGTIENHWAEAINAETRKGKRTLLDRFDQAYVKQIEAERGPITVEEYAKLSVGGERGGVDEVLQELGLPRGALLRVERVWIRRVVTNEGLASRLSELIETVREI